MIHKASNKLQLKTGTGAINPETIQNAQNYITNNNVDFVPMGREYLNTIGTTMESFENNEIEMKAAHLTMTKAVMEFKANAKVFGYDLIGDLSTILLNLMEDNEHIDKNFMRIVQAYYQTVTLIFNNKMMGDGGQNGKAIFEEFYAACQRYTQKN